MLNVLNKINPKQPVNEFVHNYKHSNNRNYVINLVDKAISRKQYTIDIDPNKLEKKVYSSTKVHLFDRHGNPLVINTTIITGKHEWQSKNTFVKHESRKQALFNAIKQIKPHKSDPNFDTLLAIKRTLILESSNQAKTITWQELDLWINICNLIENINGSTDTFILKLYNNLAIYCNEEYLCEFNRNLIDEFIEDLKRYIETNKKISYQAIYNEFKNLAFY